jgi:ferrous iron transport protein A
VNDVTGRLRRRVVLPLGGRDGPTRPLATLATGARGLVVGLRAPDSALARRLGDLGFTPGTEVQVLRRAPLGDPVVYRIRDYEICLRDQQAQVVEVEALD